MVLYTVREHDMKILLIDDDVELAAMLREYLANEGFTVTVYHTGQQGIDEALKGEYDAMVLDVMLPDMSGIDVLNQVRRNSDIPIIMLTAKGDNIDRVVGLEMGADDYIPKPCYPRELLARLRAIMRRIDEKRVEEENSYHYKGLIVDVPKHQTLWKDVSFELTATEFSLLLLLIKHRDRVLTKDELSEKGIGRPRELYDRSIDVHISNIRQKLNQITDGEISIETIRSIGYRMK